MENYFDTLTQALAYLVDENPQAVIKYNNCHTRNWEDDDEYSDGDYTVTIKYLPSSDVFDIEVEEMRGNWSTCVGNDYDLGMVVATIENEINDALNCEFEADGYDFEVID